MYACTYVTNVCMHVHMSLMYVCMYVGLHVCMYVCVCVCVYVYIYLDVCMYVWYVCMYAFMCVCMYIYHMCMHIYIFIIKRSGFWVFSKLSGAPLVGQNYHGQSALVPKSPGAHGGRAQWPDKKKPQNPLRFAMNICTCI